MTAIRFQADADLKQAIVTGTIRRRSHSSHIVRCRKAQRTTFSNIPKRLPIL